MQNIFVPPNQAAFPLIIQIFTLFLTANLSSYTIFSTGIPLAISICAKKHPMIFWPLGHKKIWKKISGPLGQYEFFFREKKLFH